MQLSKITGYKGIYQLNNYFTKGPLMPGLGYKTDLQHVCKPGSLYKYAKFYNAY